jgi:pimeloyl-ACP methyl ester carboxylesterase
MNGFGEERVAPANGIEIAYQEMGSPEGEPLLLVMGLGTQMLGWDEDLCAMLAERGFRVIRFDNRDIGHSTMIDWAGMPRQLDLFRGTRTRAAYLLGDMAADGFGLMDHLGIESAHVVGASMGGMIAQSMAIQRPARVRSLVSMMSNTGNRWLGWPSIKAFKVLFATYPKTREAYVKRAHATFSAIGSPGFPLDFERLERLAGAMWDRSHNPAGVMRQMHAITAAGDRTSALRRLRVPTTVLHGSGDPLVRPVAGRATANAIPDARLRIFDGMGHDLPQPLWPEFVEEIAAAAERGREEPTSARAA